jgi:hypothetical protein
MSLAAFPRLTKEQESSPILGHAVERATIQKFEYNHHDYSKPLLPMLFVDTSLVHVS